VSQEPMVALDPCFTISDQLVEPIRVHSKMGRGAAKKRALELLRQVGIPNAEAIAKSFPHQLSGGMAQRVGIALALTGDPKVLVADEPTTALDPTIQAEILDLLRSLQKDLGLAIVLVTHDLGVVADICDASQVMYAGQVVEQSPVEVMLEAPHHPYTRGLLAAMPESAKPGEPLPTLPGTVPLPKDWPTWCRFEARCPFAVDACRAGAIPLLRDTAERTSRCIRHDDLVKGAV